LLEFAALQNNGTETLDDIVITYVGSKHITLNMPCACRVTTRHICPIIYSVGFNGLHYLESDLTEELLEFTGICESEILFRSSRFIPINETQCFMFGNDEFNQLIAPFRLLREFAASVNTSTYSNEIVVTNIRTTSGFFHEWVVSLDWGRRNLMPEFWVGVRNANYTGDDFKERIAEYTGLDSRHIVISVIPPSNIENDFLHTNAEFYTLYRQWKLINEFNQNTYTAEYSMWGGVYTAFIWQGIRDPIFTLWFEDAAYLSDEDYIAGFFEFTGVEPESVLFRSGYIYRYNGEVLQRDMSVYYGFRNEARQLRDAAYYVNSRTNYLHEIVVIDVVDNWVILKDNNPFTNNHRVMRSAIPWQRFTVSLYSEEVLQNEELLAELLELAGLGHGDVLFDVKPIETRFVNEVMWGNREAREFAMQWIRLREFQTVSGTMFMPAHPRIIDAIPPFQVWRIGGTSQMQTQEEFMRELTEFTGIAEENIILVW
jgi:hypothetical protein